MVTSNMYFSIMSYWLKVAFSFIILFMLYLLKWDKGLKCVHIIARGCIVPFSKKYEATWFVMNSMSFASHFLSVFVTLTDRLTKINIESDGMYKIGTSGNTKKRFAERTLYFQNYLLIDACKEEHCISFVYRCQERI
jgi:hypothetical protein